MRSEGFLLNSGGLEVGVVFAQRCASDRSMFAIAMGSLSLTIGRRLQKCDPDEVLQVDFLANSRTLLRFWTCVEVAFAFCVARAVL